MGITQLKKSHLKRGFSVFALLSATVMMGILFWTTEYSTWPMVLHFKTVFIPFILLLSVARWYADGMAFVTMTKHDHSAVALPRATSIRLQGNFVSTVLPILLGHLTMHSYLLHKEKLRLSESAAISVLRAILPVFLFLLNIPILLMIKGESHQTAMFSQFLKVVSLPLVIIILFLVIALAFPARIKRVAMNVFHIGMKIKFFRTKKILDWEKRIFREVDQFHEILLTYFQQKKWVLFKTAFWILTAFMLDYFIAMGILWGFGYHPPIIHAIAYQFLIRPIIYFAFTPGGVGFWELSYLGFFSMYMPQNLIGVSVFIWRMMLTYFPMLVGGIILFHEFNKDQYLKETLIEKGRIATEEELLNSTDEDQNWS